MYRIDGPGAVGELPPTRAGVSEPGYFGPGNPATGQMSTRVTYEWLNAVQEELAAIIAAAGVTLDKARTDQLRAAVDILIQTDVAPVSAEINAAKARGQIGEYVVPATINQDLNTYITNGAYAINLTGMVNGPGLNQGVLTVFSRAKDALIQIYVESNHDPARMAIRSLKAGIWTPWRYVVTTSGMGLPYEICEFYLFRHPLLKPGFQPAYGGLLANAATRYPEAWAYLQTTEGQMLCTTEAEWQAMTKATWATLADGTKVGWEGIAGAAYYAPNTATGALRMPDLRGVFAEPAGLNSFRVGESGGDKVRNMASSVSSICGEAHSTTGAFRLGVLGAGAQLQVANAEFVVTFDPSRIVPTGEVNKPRSWGGLACCYLGVPNGV